MTPTMTGDSNPPEAEINGNGDAEPVGRTHAAEKIVVDATEMNRSPGMYLFPAAFAGIVAVGMAAWEAYNAGAPSLETIMFGLLLAQMGITITLLWFFIAESIHKDYRPALVR